VESECCELKGGAAGEHFPREVEHSPVLGAQTEESQPVRAKLSLQHFQGVALELFIGHLFDRCHAHCCLNQFHWVQDPHAR
jgi:hypothetical protein